jgi:hypothetical protein
VQLHCRVAAPEASLLPEDRHHVVAVRVEDRLDVHLPLLVRLDPRAKEADVGIETVELTLLRPALERGQVPDEVRRGHLDEAVKPFEVLEHAPHQLDVFAGHDA